MSTEPRTQRCVSCATGTMEYKVHEDVITYRGHERRLQLLAWWCDTCGEAILEGPAASARERAYAELREEEARKPR